MVITPACKEDAESILSLQKAAYQSEAVLYQDFSIPPLRQTLDELQNELISKVVLKATLDDQLAGSIRAWEKEGTCFIERVIVHPQHQGHGIGSELMKEVEKRFPGVQRFELFTGHKSKRNLRFYERHGYREFKKERVNDKLIFVFMEKKN